MNVNTQQYPAQGYMCSSDFNTCVGNTDGNTDVEGLKESILKFPGSI